MGFHGLLAETSAKVSQEDRTENSELLLLVNYRPEYQHGWGSKTYYTQLRLDPLPPASADELLQALLGDDASLQPLAVSLHTADKYHRPSRPTITGAKRHR
jgi:hypothetical protein